jgi:hypothetical protein
VKPEEIVPGSSTCKDCRRNYNHWLKARNHVPKLHLNELQSSGVPDPDGGSGGGDVRPVERGRVPPDNAGGKGIVFPRWGYASPGIDSKRGHAKYDERVMT